MKIIKKIISEFKKGYEEGKRGDNKTVSDLEEMLKNPELLARYIHAQLRVSSVMTPITGLLMQRACAAVQSQEETELDKEMMKVFQEGMAAGIKASKEVLDNLKIEDIISMIQVEN